MFYLMEMLIQMKNQHQLMTASWNMMTMCRDIKENAPFPMPNSPKPASSEHLRHSLSKTEEMIKDSTVLSYGNISAISKNIEKFDYFSQSASAVTQNFTNQSILDKVFENAIVNSSGTPDYHGRARSFTALRPQETKFRYGQHQEKVYSIEPEREKSRPEEFTEEKGNKKKDTQLSSVPDLQDLYEIDPVREEQTNVKYIDHNLDETNLDTQNIDKETIEKVEKMSGNKFFPCERSPPENHHKIQQDKRFRYGTVEDTSVNNLTRIKQRFDKKSKAVHPKESSSQIEAKDERLKESTEDSESSVEYLTTASSAETDHSVDEETVNEGKASLDMSISPKLPKEFVSSRNKKAENPKSMMLGKK